MLPTMFIAHGSPMIAIEQSEYGAFLDQLGATIGQPKAIVIFSAHWESDIQMVSDVDTYSTMYDFGGFPDELYHIQYPAHGSSSLAVKIQQLFAGEGIECATETSRGLDHGAWTILHRMYPQANIPVVSMSVNPILAPQAQFRIGRALATLREEDVLMIGSGVTVHNFDLIPARENLEVQASVRQFQAWLEETLQVWDVDTLFDYERQGPNARLAVPPYAKEHFAPLFYAMGAAGDEPVVRTLHQTWLLDVMTNVVFEFAGGATG